jgi:hypothetical protein
MNIQLLTKAINKVCPIDGLSSANEIWFKSEATEEQKALAWDIYNNWKDPQEPDITGFVFALATNAVINSWFESLPKIINNLLSVYLKDEDFELINQILFGLEIPDEVKTELINQSELFNIPLILE